MDFLRSKSKVPSAQEKAALSSHPSSSNASGEMCTEVWQQRIYTLQSQRYSPAMRLQHEIEIEKKKNRKERLNASCKSARRLETANYLSSASNMFSLQTFSNASATSHRSAPDERELLYRNLTPKTFDRASQIQKCAQQQCSPDEHVDEDEDLQQISDQLRQDLQFVSPKSPALFESVARYRDMSQSERAEATNSMKNELETLLCQLETEPSEESELTAKFALFETFLETVTVIRNQTLAFWSDNKDFFEGGYRAAAEKAVRDIDAEDCMGIQDDPRKWFVYGMTKKANSNNGKIAKTLSLLRSRLEQINSEDLGECPFCLEELAPLKAQNLTIVLSCCHRVCTPCWHHWQKIKGPQGCFCPLCRNDEFMEEVLTSPIVQEGGP